MRASLLIRGRFETRVNSASLWSPVPISRPRKIFNVHLWPYFVSWVLHHQSWPFFAPSSFVIEHDTGENDYRASIPHPIGPPTWSTSFHNLFLLLTTRPVFPYTLCSACVIFWATIPQLQRETSFPLLRQVTCTPPDADVLSLFIFFPVGSIFSLHPSWPPAWLPSHCPFYNSAEKQNLEIVISSSSETLEGTSETNLSLIYIYLYIPDQAWKESIGKVTKASRSKWKLSGLLGDPLSDQKKQIPSPSFRK